ncbi:hypothetical protein [Proteus terrae]|uniref:hypothetical protein n=1 Tax=Proteus terrae TaxID=1574161 RepID=UPI001CBE4D23|nr:hypothetical protein [Proteus terrae]
MPIIPEVVERDEDGYWMHSQFPRTEVDSEIENWVSENQLENKFVFMEGDIDEDKHHAYDRYFHTGNPDFHDWEPSKPIGEGWFIGGIYETEDGLYVLGFVLYQKNGKHIFLTLIEKPRKLHMTISVLVILAKREFKRMKSTNVSEQLHV